MPHIELPQAEFKVILLGDVRAGKTSLVHRFTQGYYRENGHESTTAAVFSAKKIQTSNGITCNIQIWDTAGIPQRRKFAHLYYKTAAAVIVCCDVTSPHNAELINMWLNELRQNITDKTFVIAIAATKVDLLPSYEDQSPSSAISDIKEIAESLDCIFMETSSKTDYNVNILFECIAERLLAIRDMKRKSSSETPTSIPKVTCKSSADPASSDYSDFADDSGSSSSEEDDFTVDTELVDKKNSKPGGGKSPVKSSFLCNRDMRICSSSENESCSVS